VRSASGVSATAEGVAIKQVADTTKTKSQKLFWFTGMIRLKTFFEPAGIIVIPPDYIPFFRNKKDLIINKAFSVSVIAHFNVSRFTQIGAIIGAS
jgi:hypothetical protein